MFFFLVIILILVFLIHKTIHSSGRAKIINKIPGPKLFPIIGNGLAILHGPVKLFYAARTDASLFKKICRLWVFNVPIVNVYDPEDIEVVLSSSKNLSKGYVYDFLHPWLKEGLLTSTGNKWQTRRKILTPTFHFNILKQFCNVIVEQTDVLIKKLRLEVGKKETEILPFISQFALHSICETAMGTNLESSQSHDIKYKKAIYDIGEHIIYRFTRPWFYSSLLYDMTPYGKQEKQVVKVLHDFTTKVIRERRVERNVSGNKFEVENMFEDDMKTSKKRLAMLDLLLSAEAENKIDESGIREEVDTFMFEGHDTTTMGIMFLLMEIANHPEIQENIANELNEIFDGSDRKATIDDLNRMKYLERCIKESLRLYPSVPYISRRITEDVQLKSYFLPSGTTLDLHIFDIHRNPDLFPNPLKFDPDRFLPDNIAKRHPFAYIPFSAGPRNCIGQKFAVLEEKAVIAGILRNFRLEPVTSADDVTFTTDLVLRTYNPVKIRFVNKETIQ